VILLIDTRLRVDEEIIPNGATKKQGSVVGRKCWLDFKNHLHIDLIQYYILLLISAFIFTMINNLQECTFHATYRTLSKEAFATFCLVQCKKWLNMFLVLQLLVKIEISYC